MLVAAGALGLSCPSHAVEIVGRVVRVANGDTITVLDVGRKRRVAGIQCPLLAESGNRAVSAIDTTLMLVRKERLAVSESNYMWHSKFRRARVEIFNSACLPNLVSADHRSRLRSLEVSNP